MHVPTSCVVSRFAAYYIFSHQFPKIYVIVLRQKHKKKKSNKMHFHISEHELDVATKGDNYSLTWGSVECRIIPEWILFRLQSNITAIGLE